MIFWQCYATITNLIREFKRGGGGHQRYLLSWTSVDRGNRGNRRKYPPDGVENRKFSIQDIQEKILYSYENISFILHLDLDMSKLFFWWAPRMLTLHMKGSVWLWVLSYWRYIIKISDPLYSVLIYEMYLWHITIILKVKWPPWIASIPAIQGQNNPRSFVVARIGWLQFLGLWGVYINQLSS